MFAYMNKFFILQLLYTEARRQIDAGGGQTSGQ